MKQNKMRIGQLANYLNVERFVIRYWEKAFGIKPRRSSGGQRFYSQKDLKKFQTIHHLLYEKKFTIAGAQNVLRHVDDATQFTASELTSLPQEVHKQQTHIPDHIKQELKRTRDTLEQLSSMLETYQFIQQE